MSLRQCLIPGSAGSFGPRLIDRIDRNGWMDRIDRQRVSQRCDLMMLKRSVLVAALFASGMLGNLSWGSSPAIGTILPRGGQRGTEVPVQISGGRIGDGVEVHFYDSTITFRDLQAVDDNNLKATFVIPADARLGEHPVRIRTKSGITELRSFFVGPLPIVAEAEPNSEFASPQAVPLNSTVEGLAQNEDVDFYVVEAKKGQRLTAEVEGMRLATTLFDPYVAILDAKRFELAASDDSSLALQDPIASVIVPEDGKYIVQVREASYGGNDSCRYRVHIGTFPRPSVPYPLGGKPNETLEVKFLGDVAGAFPQSVALPAAPNDKWSVIPVQNGESAPSPCYLRVIDLPNVLEAEPNNQLAEATRSEAAPVAFNGIIQEAGDRDFFKFPATKGQVFDINVYARRLRSPLDSVLQVLGPDGAGLASADDSFGPDSYVRFTAPADGEFHVVMHDQLLQGGVDYAYRIEIAPIATSLTLSIPQVARASQDRWAMPVPRGNRFATLILANRANFGGELTFSANDLPAGVTLSADKMGADMGTMPIVFEAAADAAVAGKLADLTAAHVDAATGIKGGYRQNVEMVYGEPNLTPYYFTMLDRLAVAVTDEVPFKIDIVPPKVPLVQNGSLNLKVVATRQEGFTKPITLYFPFTPPGVGAAAAITIPEGQNEVVYPLNANGNAAVRTWKVVVTGHADVGNGPIWVSTQLADLTIAPPYANLKIEMAAAEQGKPVEVVAKLEHATPFEGPAKINLVGLPAGVASKELEFNKETAELVFPVTIDPTSPTGQHATLFCQFTVVQDGEPIVHNTGFGGVLRIDAPPPPMPNQPAQPEVAATPAPTEKRLTRLEKLRLEQAERAKAAAAAAASGSGGN